MSVILFPALTILNRDHGNARRLPIRRIVPKVGKQLFQKMWNSI